MIRTIWGDPERFKKSYYPEDFKGKLLPRRRRRDPRRQDRLLHHHRPHRRRAERFRPPHGHDGNRVRAGEPPELVAEAAVVGRPDDLTGEAICAFVVLKRPRPTGDEAKKIAKELRNWVGKEIGPIAKPKDIRFGENLPKTRSGKIMRRLLRSWPRARRSPRTPATLENPAILDQGPGLVSGRGGLGEPVGTCCRRCSRWLTRPKKSPLGQRAFFRGNSAYLTVKTHAASLWASASLTCALAGIGTGPQTPEPPLMILAASMSTAPLSLAYLAATSL
jgi:hypothetical protein